MNYRAIFRFIALTLLIVAGLMIPALAISVIRHETASLHAFSGVIVGVGAVCLPVYLKTPPKSIRAREGYITVALAWILVSLVGCLPFFISGAIPNFMDAFFESISGFTTTGASILVNINVMPKSLLYWRSFTHWIGGMGVLVFLLALAPSTGDSMFLMRAESPGPQVSKLVPKTRQSARILYIIYIGLTVLEFLLLWPDEKVGAFTALNIAISTAGTGGFAVNNAGLAGCSPYVQWVVTVFMLLFAVNFGIYYLMIMRSFRRASRNEELRLYAGIVLFAVITVTISVLPRYRGEFWTALRHASFQTATVISTTGFATADFNTWPTYAKIVLFLLMFIGGCAGSTGGGSKVSRVLILFRSVKLSLRKLLHPNNVSKVHMDGEAVPENTVAFVHVFYGAYFVILGISVLLVSLDGFSLETTLSSVVACLNNVGPGFDSVGPMGNYHHLSALSKAVLSLDMLLGRLEIFPVLMLLLPENWRRMHALPSAKAK